MYRSAIIRVLPFVLIMGAVSSGFTVSAQQFNTSDDMQTQVESLRNWASLAIKNYPYINFRYEPMEKAYVKLACLFADEYFVPVFGERFDEMSSGKLKKNFKAIRRCTGDNKHIDERDRWMSALERPFDKEENSFGYGYMVDLVTRQRPKRDNYRLALKALDGSNLTMSNEELRKYESALYADYNVLLPSETEQIRKLIKNQETLVAGNTLKQQLQLEEQKPSTQRSLFDARNFEQTNGPLLRLATDDIKQQAAAAMKLRVQKILAALMAEEQTKLAALPAGEAGITAQNAWFADFMNSYESFRQFDAAKEVLNRYNDTRTQSLLAVKPALEARIQNAATIQELEDIERGYLTGFPFESAIANDLKAKDRQRQAFLRAGTRTVAETSVREAFQAAEKQAENMSQTLKNDHTNYGTLRVEELKYQEAWDNIYLGNYAALAALEKSPSTENVPVFMFKQVIKGYSEKCFSFLPVNRDSVIYKEKKFKYREFNHLYNRWDNYYEEVITDIIYFYPAYGYSFRNGESPADKKAGANVLKTFTNILAGDGISDLQSQVTLTQALKSDALRLIGNNGCGHPGVRIIMSNLNEYVKGRRE